MLSMLQLCTDDGVFVSNSGEFDRTRRDSVNPGRIVVSGSPERIKTKCKLDISN